MRKLRIGIGLFAWTLVIGFGILWTRSSAFPLRGNGGQLIRNLWHFASAPRRVVALELDNPVWMEVGDPIYVIAGDGEISQVGEIQQVTAPFSDGVGETRGAVRTAEALFYPNVPALGPEYQLIGYITPRSLDWVLKTMLPPAKRTAITLEIARAYQDYHAEILDALKPVAVAGFHEAVRVAQEELRTSLAAHRAELERLGDEYQQDILEKELLPMIRTEIGPTVRKHAEPLANEIGQEIWERASLWRFGWRWIYDESPLPEKNLTQAEWARFVQADIIPVLRSHSDDFIATQRKILIDIIHNPTLRLTLRDNVARVMEDKQFKALFLTIIHEAIIDNPRLRATLQQQWQSQEARQAVSLASDRIESSVRRIGDLLFGTREDGISPAFAQVLRNQILDKDCRWFVLQPTPGVRSPSATQGEQLVLHVQRGKNPDVNPFAVTLHGTR